MLAKWYCIRHIDDASLAWSVRKGWVRDESYDTFNQLEIVDFPKMGRKQHLDDAVTTNWKGLPQHETDDYLHWTATKEEMQQLRKDYELLTKDAESAAALKRLIQTVTHNRTLMESDDDGGGPLE